MNGVFFEAGAFDGEYLSNTLMYELKYNWTGVLVEASAFSYQKLLEKNRKAWTFNGCLDNVAVPTKK